MIFFVDSILSAVLCISIIGLIIYDLRRKYSYWADINVPHVAGISNDLVFRFRQHSGFVFEKIYNKFAEHPYVGFYLAGKPSLMIRDPKLIQQILVKDFDHFMDRVHQINERLDPIVANNPAEVESAKWRNLRPKLMQAFTPGKMKSIYFLLEECIGVFDKHLERVLAKSDEVEAHNLFARFAIDVIGACAFGLNCNAIENEASDFRQIGRKVGQNKYRKTLKLILSLIHPKIVSWLKFKQYNQEVEDFFYFLTRDAIQKRTDEEFKRNDFMQLLVDIYHEEQSRLLNQTDSSEEPLFTEAVVAGSVFGFFSAGFKTISSALAFCLYELALNPHLMENVYQEVIRVKSSHDGKIGYSALKEMHYMDSLFNESMRLHAPTSVLTRVCTKTYQVPDSTLVIEKNTSISIPVFSLHQDPQYFPNPKKFDPDRFNEKNKAQIIPGTYVPLGDGPRKCIGERFAKMEMKAVLAFVIEKYTIHPTERTEIPVVLDPRPMTNAPLHGIYLRFQKRDK